MAYLIWTKKGSTAVVAQGREPGKPQKGLIFQWLTAKRLNNTFKVLFSGFNNIRPRQVTSQ